MTELQYGNAECDLGHPLWLVAEGYAYCKGSGPVFFPWRLSEPQTEGWGPAKLRDGTPAWLGELFYKKEDCLAFIQTDMDAHRALYAEQAVAS